MNGSTIILRTATHVAVYAIQMVAFWVFLRGHNAPGGGFIAGVVTAGALAAVAVAFGASQAAAFLRPPVEHIVGAGLLLAVGTGVWGMLAGNPFLTHTILHSPHLPLLGVLEWPTAGFFDLGVYLTVVGASKAILVVLGGDQIRSEFGSESRRNKSSSPGGQPRPSSRG